MIACPSISKLSIRQHYDLATPFYRLLWGPHIHHGLWEQGDATPAEAQQRLIERLAHSARIVVGNRVLDVGCGMGGSSIELARRFRCHVTGLTLSPLQRFWATVSAAFQGIGQRTRFRCADAEKVHLPQESFDVVWNVECSEHLFDKPAFFRRVAGWLKPGGRLALCAWLAGSSEGSRQKAESSQLRNGSLLPTAYCLLPTAEVERQVRLVCEGFLCPSLGTAEDYLDWVSAAGLVGRRFEDLTAQVEQTWDICLQRIRIGGIYRLGGLFGQDMRRFLDHFVTLREAYRTRAMRYGLFIAEKPEC